jgi:hypothetical protein
LPTGGAGEGGGEGKHTKPVPKYAAPLAPAVSVVEGSLVSRFEETTWTSCMTRICWNGIRGLCFKTGATASEYDDLLGFSVSCFVSLKFVKGGKEREGGGLKSEKSWFVIDCEEVRWIVLNHEE